MAVNTYTNIFCLHSKSVYVFLYFCFTVEFLDTEVVVCIFIKFLFITHLSVYVTVIAFYNFVTLFLLHFRAFLTVTHHL